MAFDPDAYLAEAEAAPAPAFDPEAYLKHHEAPQDKPKTGRLASLGRGLYQGATLGFGDEISGGIAALFTDETYAQARDRIRAADATAKEDHKALYIGGEVAGGVASAFVPGLGAARGVSAAGVGLRAAATGAIQGFGSSDATDAQGLLVDSAKSAVIGGVLGGTLSKVGKLITGSGIAKSGLSEAEQQAGKMLTGEALEGATATAGKRLMAASSGAGRAAKVERVGNELLDDPLLRKAATKSPTKLETALQTRVDETMEKIAPNYDVIDGATGGFRVGNAVQAIDKRIDDLASEVGTSEYRQVLQEIKTDLVQAWSKKLGVKFDDEVGAAAFAEMKVPTTVMRKLVTNEQKISSKTLGTINESTASDLKKRVANDVRGILEEHLDEASKIVPDAVAEIRTLNQKVSTLLGLKEGVTGRAIKEARGAKSFGQQMASRDGALGLAQGVGLSVATGGVGPIVGMVGTKLAMPVLEKAGQWGVIQRALVAQAARDGSKPAVLMQRLVESGVPRSIAAAATGWTEEKLEQAGSYAGDLLKE